MPTPSAYRTEPQWPGRLIGICAELARAREPERSGLRVHAWVLLRDCLHSMLRQEAARFPGATPEDLEDVASAKALDLLLRAERGSWNPTNRSSGEVVSYLRATARHGLVRNTQQRSRTVPLERAVAREGEGEARTSEWDAPLSAPERSVESREFAERLLDCLDPLRPRSRRVWLLRAVYEMGSRDIAEHPQVRASVANVDVILMRVREHLKACLAANGHEPGPLPAGTFTLIWDRMSRAAAQDGAAPEADEA